MDSLFKLLDQLEDIIEQSKTMPFSTKTYVNKDELFEIITKIRLNLPNEVKQAKWVLEERQKILVDAQNEADDLIRNAEERFDKMINEHEITKKAYERASDIMEDSKRYAKEVRLGALEHAAKVLDKLEDCTKEAGEIIADQLEANEHYYQEMLSLISENRDELRDISNDK